MAEERISMELAIAVPRQVAEELLALWNLQGDDDGAELRDEETLHRLPSGRAEMVRQVPPHRVDAEVAVVTGLIAILAGRGAPTGPWWWRARPLHERDWRDAWKRHFHAHRVAPGLVVRPSWEPAATRRGDVEIVLDPGHAFGTGTHATTRLCLQALAALRTQGVGVRRALDAGCGSGILSIAVAKLWPEARILAVDIDPDAAAVTRENAAVNGVAQRIEAHAGSAEVVAEVGTCELVVGNIQADVLIAAADGLTRALGPGGTLVLSGILDALAPEVEAAYAARGLRLASSDLEDEWRVLVLRAPERS